MKLDRRNLFSFALLLVAEPCLARLGSQGNSQATITLLPDSITSGGAATISKIVFPGINSTEMTIGQSIVGLETRNWSSTSNAHGDVVVTLKNTSATPIVVSADLICFADASGNDGGDAVSSSVLGGIFTAVTANSSPGTFESQYKTSEVRVSSVRLLQPGETSVESGVNTINTFFLHRSGLSV